MRSVLVVPLFLSVLFCPARLHAVVSVPGQAHWIVQLTLPSLAEVEAQSRENGQPPDAIRRDVQAAAQRLDLAIADARAGIEALGGQISRTYRILLPALRVRMPAGSLERLKALPGIGRIDPERIHERMLDTSVRFVGAPKLWSARPQGLTGMGMRIGIVDSGIDYYHADFGGPGTPAAHANDDPTAIEIGSFPTPKVVGGFDFVGDEFNASGDGSNDSVTGGTPQPTPDPDPLDPKANNHGSHVAGIAAGFGVTGTGASYTGLYTTNLDVSTFRVAPGVAPEATLYALKVFGRTGTTSTFAILDALEFAADPNLDGSSADRLDVVNVSLGTSFGEDDPGESEQLACNNLTRLGCLVVVSAGNAGNASFSASQPGNASRVMMVANGIDDGDGSLTLRVASPAAIAGDYLALEGSFSKPLAETGPVSGDLVLADPADLCTAPRNAAAMKGRLVLMDRGDCLFVEKARRAQAAGALGLVAVNNVDGDPIVMGGQGADGEFTIPAVMISKADGDRLKAQRGARVSVSLSPAFILRFPEHADRISPSSSRGPNHPTGRLKPDLAAPGENILSARAGSGTLGKAESGTSMSAPHVSGAAALLRQLHPEWPVEDIKALLMNTSAPMKDADGRRYPESRIGAGRLDVAAAAKPSTIARNNGSTGEVSLSFGLLEAAVPHTETRQIRVVNHGTAPRTFEITFSNTIGGAGFTLSASPPSVTVNPATSSLVTVRLDADPAAWSPEADPTSPIQTPRGRRHPLFESSGQVWLHSPQEVLHLPYHAVYRGVGLLTNALAPVGVSTRTPSEATLLSRGASHPPTPVASLFLLGFTHPTRLSAGFNAASDLLAGGAASDFLTRGSITQATLYFGVAVAGNWTTVSRAVIKFEVQVDLNGDGLPDAAIENGSQEALAGDRVNDPTYFSDVAVSAIRKVASLPAQDLINGGPLNPIPDGAPDPATQGNNVVVLSAPAAAIGLSPDRTAFRYRIRVSTGVNLDESSWIPYDPAAAPDTCRFGLGHTPFQADRGTLRVGIDRAAAEAVASNHVVSLLLLHHHAPANARWEIARLDLATPDANRNGLPDFWEAVALGTFDATPAGDADRDGALNIEEFTAGTDPLDPASILRLLPGTLAGVSGGETAIRLRWVGAEGRLYDVLRSDSIEGPFTAVASALPGTAPVNEYVDHAATDRSNRYYRILARLPSDTAGRP